jgi:prepilin-type N-terminal cleavage/methylation domain-containing protein
MAPTLRGFTLIELAVVLVVVGLLLGGMLLTLSTQIEMQKVRDTDRQLDDIKEALLGFAIAQGRLPCPATEASQGFEWPRNPTDKCKDSTGSDSPHGFLPAATLGLSGARSADGLLVDAWGNPYRYSVSPSDVGGPLNPAASDTKWDFVVAGQMKAVANLPTGALKDLAPDLQVCNTAPSAVGATTCDDTASTVVGDDPTTTAIEPGVPLVIYSLGPNGSTFATTSQTPSADELENAGELTAPPYNYVVGAGVYLIANDKVFVARGRRGDNASTSNIDETFDDLVDWLSPNVLYTRMMTTGQL